MRLASTVASKNGLQTSGSTRRLDHRERARSDLRAKTKQKAPGQLRVDVGDVWRRPSIEAAAEGDAGRVGVGHRHHPRHHRLRHHPRCHRPHHRLHRPHHPRSPKTPQTPLGCNSPGVGWRESGQYSVPVCGIRAVFCCARPDTPGHPDLDWPAWQGGTDFRPWTTARIYFCRALCWPAFWASSLPFSP